MERVEIQEGKTIGSEDFNLGNEIFKNDYFLEITRAVKSTLGPSGMEKFLQKKTGENIITNDGASILSYINFLNPISKIITEVAKSQDFETGDGTTTMFTLLGTFNWYKKSTYRWYCTEKNFKCFKKRCFFSNSIFK